MSHGVKREEVVLPDLEVIPQVFQTSLEDESQDKMQGGWRTDAWWPLWSGGGGVCSHLQDAALRVDVRHSEHDDRSAKVVNCTEKGSCGCVGKYPNKETFRRSHETLALLVTVNMFPSVLWPVF